MNRQQRRAAERRFKAELRRTAANTPSAKSVNRMYQFGGLKLALEVERLYQIHGDPPDTKEVAAVHEAGHLVVSLSYGGVFKECWVRQQADGRWTGCTKVDIPGVTGDFIDVRKEPERAAKLATKTIAGIAAEHLCGMGHPMSSIEETFEVAAIGSAIHGEAGAQSFSLDRVTEANEIIRQHCELFGLAVQRLMEVGKVTAADLSMFNQPLEVVP